MNATIVDLRYHMKEVLQAIDRGETVTVLYRGKRKAKLTPIARETGESGKGAVRMKDQPFFGMWGDRKDLDNPTEYVGNIRRPRMALAQTSARKRNPKAK